MSEKGKVIDMAKKAQPKIEEGELKQIQELLQAQNFLQGRIGTLEIEKGKAMDAYLEGEDKLSIVKSELEKKYGKMNIDLRDGTLTPIPEPAVTQVTAPVEENTKDESKTDS